jgi:transcriptional regulator with XRE-family HTH domain
MPRAKLGTVFGVLLREHRQALGLSQETVAAKAGVHPTHVGLVERGQRTPTLDVAAALAQAVGRSLSELVREAEQWARRQSS